MINVALINATNKDAGNKNLAGISSYSPILNRFLIYLFIIKSDVKKDVQTNACLANKGPYPLNNSRSKLFSYILKNYRYDILS